MSGLPIDELLDSDPRLPAVGETSSGALAKKANEPASEAYVDGRLGEHASTCPAARKLHRWTKLACILFGIVLASQWWAYRSSRALLREEIQPMVRAAVRAELGLGPLAGPPPLTGWIPQAHAESK